MVKKEFDAKSWDPQSPLKEYYEREALRDAENKIGDPLRIPREYNHLSTEIP